MSKVMKKSKKSVNAKITSAKCANNQNVGVVVYPSVWWCWSWLEQ